MFVPQPTMDPTKPHLRYPRAVYARILETSDAEITATSSYPDPPVKREPDAAAR